MSLQRLSISLHCWPTRRPVRRAPAATPADAEAAQRPAKRFTLAEVAVEGDDVRDLERFDSMVAEAIADAAARLRRVAPDRLGALRDLGYATRVEIAAVAEGGPYDVTLPSEFVDACHRLGVGIQLASDPTEPEGADTVDAFADASRDD